MGKTNSKFFPENKIRLLNQNWVLFPTAQQTQFLLLKHQVLVHVLHGVKQGSRAAQAQKTKTPWWLSKKSF